MSSVIGHGSSSNERLTEKRPRKSFLFDMELLYVSSIGVCDSHIAFKARGETAIKNATRDTVHQAQAMRKTLVECWVVASSALKEVIHTGTETGSHDQILNYNSFSVEIHPRYSPQDGTPKTE